MIKFLRLIGFVLVGMENPILQKNELMVLRHFLRLQMRVCRSGHSPWYIHRQ